LPREIRDELNVRLQKGELGKLLVEWLDDLPVAQEVLKASFDGRAISEQNLSEWKAGGYEDWVRHQDSCAFASILTEMSRDLEEAAEETRWQKTKAEFPALRPRDELEAEWQALRQPRGRGKGKARVERVHARREGSREELAEASVKADQSKGTQRTRRTEGTEGAESNQIKANQAAGGVEEVQSSKFKAKSNPVQPSPTGLT
jgi:hypothetical protein